MNHWGSILAMAFCLMMSAYFSATETAFSSLNKTRMKVLADNGNKRAALVLRLSKDYDKLISTILIGNNIVNIAIASIGTLLFVAVYGDIGATISSVVVTVAVLIFGEITPKSIAKDYPEKFAMMSARSIRFWLVVLTPLNFLFSKWKKLVSRFIKSDGSEKVSHEELLVMVEDVEQNGGIDKNEGELLRNAIEFTDLTAQEILTHRIDVEAVDVDDSHEDIAKAFTRTRFSRLLVYQGSIDHVVGVLHQKDFYRDGSMTDEPISKVMTKPVFVYQHTKVREILKRLQMEKSHLAVVVDEFGGTLGIVSMEDILEELVGEIWDEHDDEELMFEKVGDDAYKVDCSVGMEDFCRFFGIDVDTESVSVGGWIMEHFDGIPSKGASFEVCGYEVSVLCLDSCRVSFVLVKRLG